jgi:hypothetical protein
MYDLINVDGRMGNGLGTEQGTQAEGFEIKREPLFDDPTDAATAMYDDVGDDGDTEVDDKAGTDQMLKGGCCRSSDGHRHSKEDFQEDRKLHDQGEHCALGSIGLQLAKT